MKEVTSNISFFVLSCDKYSDLWEDFFNLKEIFWPDCSFDWTIVTESVEYKRDGVNTLVCGNDLNWTGRLRKACLSANTEKVCFFLDDFFINSPIDNNTVLKCIETAVKENVDYYVLGDAFSRDIKSDAFYNENIVIIPSDRPYGIDTSVAIWDRGFLLSLIGDKDCNAWQFELDRLEEARLNVHQNRILWYDKRLPFNVGSIPVVIQGKFYPKAVKDFQKRGYNIKTDGRPVMSNVEVVKYDLKVFFSKVGFLKKPLKRFAGKFMGYKFFTK